MLVVVVLLGVGMVAVERLRPREELPEVHAWWQRVVLLNALQLGLVVLAGLTWERWLAGASLLKLAPHLGSLGQGVVAYLLSTFVFYWWHRARHESPLLWRACHQLHHAPRRLEVVTSFYKHPLEVFANSVLSAAITYLLLGCTPAGAAVYTLLAGVTEFFYHWNVRTPAWLGLLIQRPEAHRLHHERGRHAGNYGDLPLWDRLFGTFRDPEQEGSVACGFDARLEDRFEDMLACRDVHAAEAEGRKPLTFLPASLGGAERPSPSQRAHATRANVAAILVFLLGSTQLVGAITGSRVLRGLGAASAAAPLPKVFTAHRGFETFASDFELRYQHEGREVELALSPEAYQTLRGPYNRRNVYGAALSYGPVLPERLLEPILRYGLGPGGTLREELGVPSDATHLQVVVRSKTRGRSRTWVSTSPE